MKKVFRITLPSGEKQTCGSIRELHEKYKDTIRISYNSVCNSFYKNDGVWEGRNGLKIERLEVRPTIIER